MRLELRGAGWIVNPHVQHDLAADYTSATMNVSVEVGGQSAGTGFALHVTITDPTNKTVGSDKVNCPDLGKFCTGAHTSLAAPQLWSPESPMQHTAHIVSHTITVRFAYAGIRATSCSSCLSIELHGYADRSSSILLAQS
eukprot:COSAG02_NODE_19_length_53976_cov_37.338512_24_plen_140_part_00